jgi:hypothetical protein
VEVHTVGMTAVGNRDRILETLRRSPRPLDDDQLSDRTEIRPRQQVNQICRILEREGVIRRYQGQDQKIVNEMINTEGLTADVHRDPVTGVGGLTPDAATVFTASEHSPPPGDSRAQRDAERVMLDLLGRQLGLVLEPARITISSGTRVEVDGCDADRTVLVECWAHQGPPKVAQRHKVLSDALKLTWISTTIYPRPRLILCLSDPLAAAPFLPPSKSWAARALQDLGIAVSVVDLPDDVRQEVKAAQERQYR